jgi:hypothetical protein
MINFKHPKDVHLGYFKHLRFTWFESIRLAGMCLIMFIHGLIPFIFDHSFSSYIEKASERIKKIGT